MEILMSESDKQMIEEKLLSAMKSLDGALNIIYQSDNIGLLETAGKLSNSKADIKRVLNAHFDKCARDRSKRNKS